MSSPKSAVARSARRSKPAAVATDTDSTVLSVEAQRLAGEIERALADGRSDALSPDALQALVTALCRAYAAQVESGAETLPLARGAVTSTDVMLMASALLRSANLAVFELGMWQSWTGR